MVFIEIPALIVMGAAIVSAVGAVAGLMKVAYEVFERYMSIPPVLPPPALDDSQINNASMNSYNKLSKELADIKIEQENEKLQRRRAASAKIGLSSKKYNFAVCGNSGTGKSTFVNTVRGLRASDPGAAAVGISETTHDITPYQHAHFPHIVLWDVPGAGTLAHPVRTYYEDKALAAMDCLLIVYAVRLTEADLQLALIARKEKTPFVIVRNKADQALAEVENDRDLPTNEAKAVVRKAAEEEFAGVASYLGVDRESITAYCISSLPKAKGMFDEVALLVHLAHLAILRRGPTEVPSLEGPGPSQHHH